MRGSKCLRMAANLNTLESVSNPRWFFPWVGCRLTRLACNDASGVQILANHPIPAGIERFYYEVEIRKDVGDDTKM